MPAGNGSDTSCHQPDRVLTVRIARFTLDEDPQFGLLGVDDNGQQMLAPIDTDPLYRPPTLTGEKYALDEVRLLAPVLPRSKVVGVGRNYAAHAAAMGAEVPDEPLLFFKPNTSVIGPDDPIVIPSQTQDVSQEVELAVVIGRVCKDITAEGAAEVIFGYTVANDVTARDLQGSDGQWARAKGFDTFCPLGPWIETELDVSDIPVRSSVNDDLRQDGRTSDMVHTVPDLIAYISAAFTLLPGDVILTGTPKGAGPIVAGDRVSVSIDDIGTLTNPVVDRGMMAE